jgi:hypothetical protein
MLQQIFLGAVEVKGSANTVVFEWLKGLLNPYWISYKMRSIAVFIFACFIASKLSKRWVILKTSSYFENLILAFGIGVFTVALVLIRHNTLDFSHGLPNQIWESLHEMMFLTPLLVLVYMFIKFRNLDSPWIPLIILSFAFAWGNGMSAGLTEYGTFFSFITAFAFILGSFGLNKIFAIFTLTTAVIASTVLYTNRLAVPYSWWGYSTPSAAQATVTSAIGLTKGLKFSEKGYEEFQNVYRQLNNLSCRGEVVGYPHMPLFALDADRLPAGKAALYWHDFIGKENLENEVKRIKISQLAAIIEMPLPGVLSQHEILFKNGITPLRNNFDRLIKNHAIEHNFTFFKTLGINQSLCK